MSYATLLVWVNVDHVAQGLVGVAAAIADRFAARLIGSSAVTTAPPFIADGIVIIDAATDADVALMKANLAEAGKKVQAIVGNDRQTEWRSTLDFPTQTLMEEARCADLILIGREKFGDPYRVVDVGAAILGAGRPFLVVPPGVKSLAAENVLVGWKDTREARRAVQDALPFLHEAKRVTVLEICASDRENDARNHVDDVVRYLAQHRIKAERRIEIETHGSAADKIVELAEDEGADLLVTGAYGHSRFNEWIFGGMTRELLGSSPVCCLMSH